ncbi:MAG: flagellar assembly protein FliH [Succinivibrionaceae bacterium]|nr:flagellar assembly protein FliH [Succinivibrionaceae bacterium]MDY6337031.1 flagellar assembly protein FliH [Succinivibrionaceae bacterium]
MASAGISGRNRGGSSFLGARARESLDGAPADAGAGAEDLGSLFPGFGESPEEAAAQPDGGWAQVSGDDTAPAGGSGTGPVAPRARSGALSRSSPFSDDGSVSLEDTGASAGRYHYSAFSSPNPFMSDDEISPAPPAESPAAAPDETQSGDAAEPPEDGHDAADQVPPEHDGQGAEKSNVFGYEEGWYQKGLEEERRRKEEAEAKERNEVPCITLAELEEIRKGAYDDGFAEGKKEGFAKGHEDGLASGHGEGLKSGHDEGYQAGIADGAAAVDAEKAKFAALAEKLGKPLELVNESIEKELLVVVSRIARAFLEKEARVPEFLAKSLHAAVAALPSTKEGVTVMLNPADAAELLKLMPEESLSDLGWKVVSDASVGAGDIRIDSGSSSVDWKLSERIDAVIERFVNENSGGNG